MICWFLTGAWITAISRESRNSCLTPPEQYDGGILEKPAPNDLWTRPKSFSQRGWASERPNELLLTPRKWRIDGLNRVQSFLSLPGLERNLG